MQTNDRTIEWRVRIIHRIDCTRNQVRHRVIGGIVRIATGEDLIRHHTDFFLDFAGIEHDNSVPRAAIEETAVGSLARAFLAADA